MSPVACKVGAAKAWYALAVLLVLYVLSYIDRSALSIFVDPIKHDLGLTDTGFALVTGAAFALFYSSMAIPLAAVSDRHGRRWIIVAGVLLWGLATAGSGLVGGFWALFVLRLGVGLGEAALTPNAWAMVPQLFPPDQRGRAMAIFTCGGVIGSGLALMVPAMIGDASVSAWNSAFPSIEALAPWRMALLALGIVTVICAVPALFLPNLKAETAHRPESTRAVIASFWRRRQSLATLFICGPLLNAVAVATMIWLPAYFIRWHDWTLLETGRRLGVGFVIAGFSGTLISGYLADRWNMAQDAQRCLKLVAIGSLLSLPFLLASQLVVGAWLSLVLVTVALTFQNFMSTLLPLAVQAKAEPSQRAQTGALFLLWANLVGFGLGPTLPALLSDHVFGDPQSIGWAVMIVAALGSGLGATVIFRRRHVGADSTMSSPAGLQGPTRPGTLP